MNNIIVCTRGGIGNQMFCYAIGYAVSKKNDAKLYIDTMEHDNKLSRKFEICNFNIQYEERISYKYHKNILSKIFYNKIARRQKIGWLTRVKNEKKEMHYDSAIKENVCTDIYLKGYWQTEKYFKEYRQELLSIFTPVKSRDESVLQIIRDLERVNSVAVHVRRGDYLDEHWELNMEYYDKAISLLSIKQKEMKLYVFSDEIEYCKEYFARYEDSFDFNYLEYFSDNYSIDDLLIMSKCKHNIIANSTYSWWAAWLNQNEYKMVICPELKIWTNDFYPEEWMRILL